MENFLTLYTLFLSLSENLIIGGLEEAIFTIMIYSKKVIK